MPFDPNLLCNVILLRGFLGAPRASPGLAIIGRIRSLILHSPPLSTKRRERYVAGKTARMLECLLVILLCFLLLAAYALWPAHVSVDIAQFPRKYADDKVYL